MEAQYVKSVLCGVEAEGYKAQSLSEGTHHAGEKTENAFQWTPMVTASCQMREPREVYEQ